MIYSPVSVYILLRSDSMEKEANATAKWYATRALYGGAGGSLVGSAAGAAAHPEDRKKGALRGALLGAAGGAGGDVVSTLGRHGLFRALQGSRLDKYFLKHPRLDEAVMNAVGVGGLALPPAAAAALAAHRKNSGMKKKAMSFLEQDRPEKVKEIYRALKRDHPEMPAEMKARIAARQGKPGKQHQGPPYKGPIKDKIAAVLENKAETNADLHDDNEDVKHCIECGAAIGEDDKHCKKCGARQVVPSRSPPTPKRKRVNDEDKSEEEYLEQGETGGKAAAMDKVSFQLIRKALKPAQQKTYDLVLGIGSVGGGLYGAKKISQAAGEGMVRTASARRGINPAYNIRQGKKRFKIMEALARSKK